MKKSIAILICLVVILSMCFVACSSKENDNDEKESSVQTTQESGLVSGDEFGFETDKDGNQVMVKYEKDKKGNVVAYVVDENGEKTKDTVKPNNYVETVENGEIKNNTTTQKDIINNNTSKVEETTNPELTTLVSDKDIVPSLNDTGKQVSFNDYDIQTLTKMLEVPYLYNANYENKDGVPINIAKHVACWMAYNKGISNSKLTSSEVIIDLFSFFAETVVDFKTKCNTAENDKNPAEITYLSSEDMFNISSYESRTHKVTIDKIENLGNNNYYKVYASVVGINDSNCKAKKVTAIVQKNKLNLDLGFSIKALKWQ